VGVSGKDHEFVGRLKKLVFLAVIHGVRYAREKTGRIVVNVALGVLFFLGDRPRSHRDPAVRWVDDSRGPALFVEIRGMFFEALVCTARIPIRETPEASDVRPAVRRTRRIERCRCIQRASVENGGSVVWASRICNPSLGDRG
jgi:hypothetical protein